VRADSRHWEFEATNWQLFGEKIQSTKKLWLSVSKDWSGKSLEHLNQDLICQVVLKKSPRKTVPGGFDALLYQLSEQIDAVGYVKRCRNIETAGPKRWTLFSPERSFLASWRLKFREHLQEILKEVGDPESRAVLLAMILGEKHGLTPELHDIFRKSGLYHILVVSGSNLALLGAFFYGVVAFLLSLNPNWLLKMNRHWLSSCIAMVGMALYLYIVGEQAPVIRAFYVAGSLFLTICWLRPFTPLHALWLAMLLMLLGNPFFIFSVSFQLTISATFGILYIYEQRGVELMEKLTLLLKSPSISSKQNRLRGYLQKITGVLALAWLLTLGAFIFTLPVLIYNFHRLSLWGLICNGLYTPWLGWLVMPSGFAGLLLSPICAPLAKLCLNFSTFWIAGMVENLRWFAHLPGADFRLALPNFLSIIFWYLAALFFIGKKYPHLRWITLWAALLLYLPYSFWPQLHGIVLDVGNGLAMVFEMDEPLKFPKFIIVDTGSRHTCHRGIIPYLESRGVRRIEAVYLSHWDEDHVGCLSEVQKNFEIKNIYASYPPPTEKKMTNLSFKLLKEGDLQHFGRMSIAVISPNQTVAFPTKSNNQSLVLVLHTARQNWMLPGDIEKLVEPEVLENWRRKETMSSVSHLNLLVAPHHGSKTSSSADFVEGLRPEKVIISRQRPAGKGVLERYQKIGSEIYWTRKLGSILFEADGEHSDPQIKGYACNSAGKPYHGWGWCP
jgi:competence protein ComEC